MAIARQRDLVITLKRETFYNVDILSKLHPMSTVLSRMIFNDDGLEKPTQNLFNHLSHYLFCIIDSKRSAALPWPLYDTKTERNYRNEFSTIVAEYSSKGLVSPVMSSYLVNPGCFKVTILIYQLSLLAVQCVLKQKMDKDHQKALYNDMTEKYKAQDKAGFTEAIDKVTQSMLSKFSKYIHKRDVLIEIAGILSKKITHMESVTSKTQKYINNIIDTVLRQSNFDDEIKSEIIKVKNINEPILIFEMWLEHFDTQMDKLESDWNTNMTSFLHTSREAQQNSEALLQRHTGEADESSYRLQYNPQTMEIDTKELQTLVNSEQKYVLKNIVKNERLSFPNLVRGFAIAICCILRNLEDGDNIFQFNQYLSTGCKNYKEVVSAMKILLDRMINVEARLETPQYYSSQDISLKELSEIPPLPDLSDLKITRELQYHLSYENFTPLNLKHKFNMNKKNSTFMRTQPKPLYTPFQASRDNILKNLVSCRDVSTDRNISQNIHNLSVIPHVNRANETITECSSGFTKQQILRLLSTKKTSSSKKFKYKTDRSDIHVKKGGLFNESATSNDSNGLFRSYSSPDLFENRERKSRRRRKLSVMKEDNPSILEVSGIVELDREISYGSPNMVNLESTRKQIDAQSLPTITLTSNAENKINNILKEMEVDLDKEIDNSPDANTFDSLEGLLSGKCNSTAIEQNVTVVTPKVNQSAAKTSSIEKIISRFNKVRSNRISIELKESECRTIVEEKENFSTVNVEIPAANRVLLPDLLSPSCALSSNSMGYLDQLCFDIDTKVSRKPRESLGTALGVDNTFLDQFDLID